MTDLVQAILDNQFNPVGMQTVIYDYLTDITNGEVVVVDPTNPVAFTIQSASQLFAAFMEKSEALHRKQYASLAQTQDELYGHMTDKDYLNRFAIPSRAKMIYAVSVLELLTEMKLDTATGMLKMVMPRNSSFAVANTSFGIHYPIEIQRQTHGAFRVVYDNSIISPLQSLETNLVDWQITNYAGTDFLVITFDVEQFKLSSYNVSVTLGAAVQLDIPIADQFYYARVYVQNSDLTWTEIKTTFSREIYDPAVPTAQLLLNGPLLNVTIPQIYVRSGQVKGMLRVDLYETLGNIEFNLGAHPPENFVGTFKSLDAAENNEFVAPFSTLKTQRIFSDAIATGGRNSVSFTELRSRVINNTTGAQNIPITQAQAQTALQNKGYEIIKNIDNITDRVFLAVKPLPAPSDGSTLTEASLGMETLTTSFADLQLVDTIVNNGSSITITPDTLYEINDGTISIVPSAKRRELLALQPDQLALAVTNGNYYFSPLHYVLESVNDEFASRPCYLDGPSIVSKTFIDTNDTTLLGVSVDFYDLFRSPTGYTLRVGVSSTQEYKDIPDEDVFAQLSFISIKEKQRAYLNGTLFGTDPETLERIFEFDLSSNMNVQTDGSLQLTKFQLYAADDALTSTPLIGDFDIVFGTTAVLSDAWKTSDIDNVLGRFLLGAKAAAISQEQLKLRFGYSLTTLWSRARTITAGIEYEKYPEDVLATYSQDIYEIDPLTGSAISFDSNGQIVMNILHKKGDPILDANGDQIIKYRKGSTVISPITGRAVIANPRSIVRQFNLLLAEGAYWFATDQTSVSYRKYVISLIVNWLVNDLTSIQKELLDKTRLYFCPKSNLGNLEVLVGASQVRHIQAGQSFRATLYVSKEVDDNPKLKKKLEETTIKVINSELKNEVVAISKIQDSLRTQYGSDVIEVAVTGLGGSANYPVLTILDNKGRCSIKKKLVAQGDSTLAVVEDVTVVFLRHDNT